ncbi:hypothetical protein Bbelb_298780 [Branchiostoma belcheri]|nr:hypothetical protein Bbelb_298780 [Branchiostoma belcheri]
MPVDTDFVLPVHRGPTPGHVLALQELAGLFVKLRGNSLPQLLPDRSWHTTTLAGADWDLAAGVFAATWGFLEFHLWAGTGYRCLSSGNHGNSLAAGVSHLVSMETRDRWFPLVLKLFSQSRLLTAGINQSDIFKETTLSPRQAKAFVYQPTMLIGILHRRNINRPADTTIDCPRLAIHVPSCGLKKTGVWRQGDHIPPSI